MIVALISAAVAGEPAYYHPDDVAGQSAVFRDVANQVAPAFDSAQSTIMTMGQHLESLDTGVALLGSQAPDTTLTWRDDSRKQIMGQFLQIQRHLNLLQDDYARVFDEALTRALPQFSDTHTVVECASGGMQAMLNRRGEACEGTELNSALATAIDIDEQLQSELEEIHSIPWPTVGIDPTPQEVVALTGSENWVSASQIAQHWISDRLDQHMDNYVENIEPLEEAIDSGDEASIRLAEEHQQAYLAAVGAEGQRLWSLITEALNRSNSGPATNVGICANPEGMGACPGEDVTNQIIQLLEDNRKFNRALTKD